MARVGTVEHGMQVVKKEVGTIEQPPGSNKTKYGKAYGLDGYAWCAMFVWWVLSLKEKLTHIKSAYTPTVFEYYRSKGRTFRDPKEVSAGDLVFFDFPDSLNRIQHIGFATGKQRRDGLIPTTEGNTAGTAVGSQDDGGAVANKLRPMAYIVGFAKPLWKNAPEKPVYDFPKKHKAYFGRKDSGADVKNWQRDLNWYFSLPGHKDHNIHLVVDGEFGLSTLKATKQFQFDQKLDVTGRVGTKTIEVMERLRDNH